MEQEQINFENLPAAVSKLLGIVSNIEKQLFNTNQTSPPVKSLDQLLTVHQAADFLSLAVPTVYSMVSKGDLPCMKRSKRIYFSSLELMDYLKAGRKKPVSEIEAEAEAFIQSKQKKS